VPEHRRELIATRVVAAAKKVLGSQAPFHARGWNQGDWLSRGPSHPSRCDHRETSSASSPRIWRLGKTESPNRARYRRLRLATGNWVETAAEAKGPRFQAFDIVRRSRL